MRFILKIFFWFLKIIAAILLILFTIVAIEYIICPVYNFPEPKAFQGEHLFNPYQDIDKPHWRRANFQVQSHAWGGVTNGRKNDNVIIDSVYQSLGYEVIAISDYQKINNFGSEKPEYIPVYEHGYGVYKTHQVLIGAKRVTWTDYPLFQTLHNKQHIIDLLKENNELVYLAHPKIRDAYMAEDLKYLSGYTGVEVLNYFGLSPHHWDSALSAGYPVTILGNDDAHDVSKPDEVGHRCTYIHSNSLHGDSIVEALRAGKAYGFDVKRHPDEPMDVKIAKAKTLPYLVYAKLKGDTLNVKISGGVKHIVFKGQNGIVKAVVEGLNSAAYLFKENDTYIRTEILFYDLSVMYLNPVFRYDGNDPWKQRSAEINEYKTWLLRVLGFASIIFIILNLVFIRRYFRRKRLNG
ncbi:hypothetical protein ACFLRY_02910 [Bacteroidota bacterium]